MKKSWNTQEIAEFTRDILGCGCPERVFNKIEVTRVGKGVLPLAATRINVGNTLLIYVIRPESHKELLGAIGKLVSKGRADRDGNGFNRFRLVIAGDARELNSNVATGKLSAEAG